MTSGSAHIKSNPLPHVLPQPSSSWCCRGISFVMIHTQSQFQERRAPEALKQRRARVYMLLKNRLVLWSLEQPHAPEPSLLIRGRPGKHMAGASALWWIATANPHQGHLTNHRKLWLVCVCVCTWSQPAPHRYNPSAITNLTSAWTRQTRVHPRFLKNYRWFQIKTEWSCLTKSWISPHLCSWVTSLIHKHDFIK